MTAAPAVCPLCFRPAHPNSWCFGPTPAPTPVTAAPSTVQLTATNPTAGCTGPGCNSQQTVQLHPYHGRQCPDHMTLPAGGYRRDLAEDMVALGRADAAFAYLLGWLAHETGVRFTRALDRVGAA